MLRNKNATLFYLKKTRARPLHPSPHLYQGTLVAAPLRKSLLAPRLLAAERGERAPQLRAEVDVFHGARDPRRHALLDHPLHLLLLVRAAFPVPQQVPAAERQGDGVHHEPREVEFEDADHREGHPDHGRHVERGPEDVRVHLVDDGGILPALEDPRGVPLPVHTVPPTQADKVPPGHVLHRPKVEAQTQDHRHDGDHVILRQPESEEVQEHRQSLEQ
mmetsp:Transcript_45161/g.88352  ORF Transcript_45161/g.88352 Transcript_45161/m.88352 type:complete len:218 (+) Transcript_45161:237-890(+)